MVVGTVVRAGVEEKVGGGEGGAVVVETVVRAGVEGVGKVVHC